MLDHSGTVRVPSLSLTCPLTDTVQAEVGCGLHTCRPCKVCYSTLTLCRALFLCC